MDASDHTRDLLELAVVTAQSLPVAGWGGILIDLLAGTWRAASSSTAIPVTPTVAASTLAAGWAFVGHETAAASISQALLSDS